MYKDIIDKNFDNIVKATNKYLKKLNYEYNGENLSIKIKQDEENEEFKLVTYPENIFEGNLIFTFNRQGDIFLIDATVDMFDSLPKKLTKLVSYNFMYREAPELIVREIFKTVLSEKVILQDEINNMIHEEM